MRLSMVAVAGRLLSAGAMTPVVRTKPESTAEQASADPMDCHRLADDAAWRLGWEQRRPLVDFCMPSKGYHLERLPY